MNQAVGSRLGGALITIRVGRKFLRNFQLIDFIIPPPFGRGNFRLARSAAEAKAGKPGSARVGLHCTNGPAPTLAAFASGFGGLTSALFAVPQGAPRACRAGGDCRLATQLNPKTLHRGSLSPTIADDWAGRDGGGRSSLAA